MSKGTEVPAHRRALHEHLRVRYSDSKYSEGVLISSPVTRKPSKFCPSRVLNREPSAFKPSPRQTELPHSREETHEHHTQINHLNPTPLRACRLLQTSFYISMLMGMVKNSWRVYKRADVCWTIRLWLQINTWGCGVIYSPNHCAYACIIMISGRYE